MVADIVNQIRGFGMQRQRLPEFGVCRFIVLFLASAVSRGVASFGGVQRAEFLNFRAGFFFSTAGNTRSAAIELDQRLHGGEISRVQTDGSLKFSSGFLGQRKRAHPAGTIGFFAKPTAEKLVISGIVAVQGDRSLSGGESTVVLGEF